MPDDPLFSDRASGKKVWILLCNRTGDDNQVRALATAVGLPFEVKELEFNRLRHVRRLRDERLLYLTQEARAKLVLPWPDLVIGLGYESMTAIDDAPRGGGVDFLLACLQQVDAAGDDRLLELPAGRIEHQLCALAADVGAHSGVKAVRHARRKRAARNEIVAAALGGGLNTGAKLFRCDGRPFGHEPIFAMRRMLMIKIDRSFVTNIQGNKESLAITRAVTTLANALSVPVCVEGIESEGALEAVVALGCEVGQGWYFGKPMPSEQARDLLNLRAGSATELRPNVAHG